MMDEYIKRADVYEILHRMFCDRCGDYTYCEVCDVQRFYNLVRAQPYCDVVEVRHEYWLYDGYEAEYRCSYCGEERPREDAEYCCGCGAKMNREGR